MEKKRIGWRGFPDIHSIYIFLFSVYPILFLYKQNIAEVAFGELVLPMAFAVALTMALWLGLYFIYRNPAKRAFVIFVVLLVMFYYKLVFDVLVELIGTFMMPFAHGAAIILLFVLPGALFFWVHRTKRSFANAGRALQAILAVLLAWNVGAIALYHLRSSNANNARVFLQKTEWRAPASAVAKPDIYCIILDEFASLETARDIFHHDHSQFAARLRAAGFFVAAQSRGLYIWTPEAIAALLNMGRVPEQTDPSVLIQQNQVTRFLKEQGYAIYDFPYKGLTALADAREHFSYDPESTSIFFNDFYKTLIDMSVFYSWAQKWQDDENKYALFFRNRVLYVFQHMPAVVKLAGPKFVLVHLYNPHAPFVFDHLGGAVAPEHHIDYSDRRYYLEQYIYISRRLAEMVEMILAESAAPPIIIALSDHGYRGSFRKPLLHVVSRSEKLKIFLALYLPGFPDSKLALDLSPLNVFRIILSHYFGQSLPEIHD